MIILEQKEGGWDSNLSKAWDMHSKCKGPEAGRSFGELPGHRKTHVSELQGARQSMAAKTRGAL